MIRPRFTEREGRLLLAAVYSACKHYQNDREYHELHVKLAKTFGSEDELRNARSAEYAGRFS